VGGGIWGPQGSRNHRSTFRTRSASILKAGRISSTVKCGVKGGDFLASDPRSQERLRRLEGQELAREAGAVPQSAAPTDRPQGDTAGDAASRSSDVGRRCKACTTMRNRVRLNVERKAVTSGDGLLLHSYFARTPDEAEELLERQSGKPRQPRILRSVQRADRHWLDFFMFNTVTDAAASHADAPCRRGRRALARTTSHADREAHHMCRRDPGSRASSSEPSDDEDGRLLGSRGKSADRHRDRSRSTGTSGSASASTSTAA